jgi:hypothetical protein
MNPTLLERTIDLLPRCDHLTARQISERAARDRDGKPLVTEAWLAKFRVHARKKPGKVDPCVRAVQALHDFLVLEAYGRGEPSASRRQRRRKVA